MKQPVFEPLQMIDSSYVWQDKFETLAATGHNGAGLPGNRFGPTEAGAASTMHTTARDYARFMIAVMNGKAPASETAVDAGCSNCIGRPVTRKSETISWGLGWGIEETAHGQRFWHWGDNGDFKALVVGDAKAKRGIVGFANSSNGLMILPEIAAEIMGEKQPAFDWLHYE